MLDTRYILCPGQGAQAVGMAKALTDKYPTAKSFFGRASAVLGYDLLAVCTSGPEERLNQTDVAQPALFVAGVASFDVAGQLGLLSETLAFAGLSLGEYTALHLAGAFDFETGVDLVRQRGALMQSAATATASGMVAIVGSDVPAVEQLCAENSHGEVLVTANFNAPGQIVVSGSLAACQRILGAATAAGIKAVSLKVAGAFHSPIMQPAADQMRQVLEAASLKAPNAVVYSNVTAAAHTDLASIKDLLVRQIVAPVKWQQTLEAILAAQPAATFVELSPGRTLTGLARRINRRLPIENVDEKISG